ncbi:unnamed protein product [Rotaria sp. Silwood1]|nr:unnamed protein product [Rotaria sp. Silwood1]
MKNLEENHPEVARCYSDLGKMCRSKKQYRCALNYQHIALTIRSQCLPSNHPNIAQSHTDIAAIHFDLGEYSLAIDHNQAALQIESKTLPSNHLSLATSYDYLAVTYDHVGDRETAKEYFLKAQFINENNALFAQQNPYQTISYQCPICKHHLTESSIGQMLHYLHLLLDIQNCKKIYSFSINCKQITFFYVEKESKSNLYNYYKSQDLDMFNNYSETSLPVDMIITKEEWKNKYLNEVIWKIFTIFLTMSDNFYEYATLNINPRDDLFDCRYMIRKKLGIGLTSMVYLLEKKEDNYLIEDSPHYVMKILKENNYSEYFLTEIKITEKLKQFDNSNKFYLFFQDILSPLLSDIHRTSCINGKFCPDCCFLYKNVNINIEKERQCLQDFIVCLDAFKKSYASLTESSIGQMLHYLHLLLDIQNRKKIYGFPINCKQITFFYVEKECKSNLYNYYKSQDLDMFNNYSETS